MKRVLTDKEVMKVGKSYCIHLVDTLGDDVLELSM
jgi:hypothetical protein